MLTAPKRSVPVKVLLGPTRREEAEGEGGKQRERRDELITVTCLGCSVTSAKFEVHLLNNDSGIHTGCQQQHTHTGCQQRCTDTGCQQQCTDTGCQQQHTDIVCQQQHTDTVCQQQHTDTGSQQQHTDTGSQQQHTDTGCQQQLEVNICLLQTDNKLLHSIQNNTVLPKN